MTVSNCKRRGLPRRPFMPDGRLGGLTMAKSRNSNIELLRILSILIIMWTHLSVLPSLKEADYPFLSGLIADWGGIGDNLFFGITAWFMCNESPNFRKSCHRVWKLEQQLLFYSLGLFVVCTMLFLSGYPIFHSMGSWLHLGVVSVLPVLTGLWWYPSAYVVFVLICPWLTRGLRAIGRAGHGFIAILGIVMWGILPYVSKGMDLSVFMFFYLYVPMAYLRWYRSDWERSRFVAWALTLGGLFVSSACYAIRKIVVGSFTYGVNPWYLPSMCAALGIILLTTQARPRHSRVINAVAKSTLAVYLVHLNWGILPLWQHILSRILISSGLSNQPWLLFIAHFACVALLYLFIVVIDMVRRKLFDLTVNRPGRENRWFNRGWTSLVRFSPKLAQNNL